MTAQILKFEPPKKKVRQAEAALPAAMVLRSNFEIFGDVQLDILAAWRSAAERDKLNAFIKSVFVAADVKLKRQADYTLDLNALAQVELALQMKVATFFPGCTRHNEFGWLVAFHRGQEIFSTPPHMASEALARAMNIVLFITFEKTLKELGRA